jgi:nitronate monooxygenase
MRTFYALRSLRTLKRSARAHLAAEAWWQAGKSVGTITTVEPAGDIVRRFAAARSA